MAPVPGLIDCQGHTAQQDHLKCFKLGKFLQMTENPAKSIRVAEANRFGIDPVMGQGFFQLLKF